jgi:hypothetical protein
MGQTPQRSKGKRGRERRRRRRRRIGCEMHSSRSGKGQVAVVVHKYSDENSC